MRDLIDRQTAIDAIEKHIRTAEEPYRLTETDRILNHAFDIAASCVYNLPSAQPDEEKISDLLYDVYRLTCPQLGTGGVAVLKSYISMVYREIFGEEGPEWMR